MLTVIKRYLQRRGEATLADIATHLGSSPEAVQGMLDKWIERGRVRQLSLTSDCDSCSKCDSSSVEIYQWINEETDRPQPPSITPPNHCKP